MFNIKSRVLPVKGKCYLKGSNPNIKLYDSMLVIQQALSQCKKDSNFLDIGGKTDVKMGGAEKFKYTIFNIEDGNDISNCPEVPDNEFDITFSKNTLEHIRNIKEAMDEIYRITKPGGLTIHRTLFSWRYHPCLHDYWRFTHEGLKTLFEDVGFKTMICGYDISMRRWNIYGGIVGKLIDNVVIDWLGGWRENWIVFYIGKKL